MEREYGSLFDENYPFYIIFEDNVPFSLVFDVKVLLQSMPFYNIRIFCFSRRTEVMTEVQVKGAYPFSRDPDPRDLEKAL